MVLRLGRIGCYLWAAPATCLGLIAWPIAVLSGGTASWVAGVLEIQGGWVTRVLRGPLPGVRCCAAMTLGHVVLGQDQTCLEQSRAHERIHVRQYEQWGPLFIPAYLASSLWLYWSGRDPYWDNPFERDAYLSS